jgi:hypothetical protein
VRASRTSVLLFATGLTGCFAAVGEPNAGDAGLSANAAVLDAGSDAGLDEGTDAGLDAGTDAGLEADTDAGPDAGTDAGLDAGSDAGSDADAGAVCTIGGQSYARRAQNPANRAQCCNPVLDPTGWTPLFSQGASYALTPTGYNVTGTGVAKDLDGDGIIDLALGGDSLGVDVYLGLPGGGFADPIHSPITSNSGVSGVISGTFRSDGGIDLLLTFGTASEIALLINQGGGKFGDEMVFPVGANGYFAPVAADFNGDGWLDVAWGRVDGKIGVLFNLGQGDGKFGNDVALDPGVAIDIRGVAAGDFDGDGVMDVAASSVGLALGEGEVPIFLGIGDGGFQAPILNTAIGNPWQIGAGRLVGGLLDDLAFGSGDQDDAYVIEHNLGGLTAATGYPNGGATEGVLLIADIDGDGANDIVQAQPGLLVVLFNKGDGTFWPPAVMPISLTGWQDIIVGDLNSDGAIDVAWVPLQGSWTEILNGCP